MVNHNWDMTQWSLNRGGIQEQVSLYTVLLEIANTILL